jgi:predicted PurR-regulated permease PerM
VKIKRGRVVTEGFFRSDEFKKYFFWAIVVVLLILSYLILEQYLITLVSAFILAYLVKPLYVRFAKKTGKSLGAFLAIGVVFVVLILPISLVIGGVVQQVSKFAASDGFNDLIEGLSSNEILQNLLQDESVSRIGDQVSDFILSMFTTALRHVPSLIVSLVIILFGMYYILTGWEDLSKSLQRYLPFKNRSEVVDEVADITNNIVMGLSSWL